MEVCLEHKGNPIKWVCESCGKKPLCFLCLSSGNHKNHTVMEGSVYLINRVCALETSAKKAREDIGDILGKMHLEEYNKERLIKGLMEFRDSITNSIDKNLIEPVMKEQEKILSKLRKSTAKLVPQLKIVESEYEALVAPTWKEIEKGNYFSESVNGKMHTMNSVYDYMHKLKSSALQCGLNVYTIIDLYKEKAQIKGIIENYSKTLSINQLPIDMSKLVMCHTKGKMVFCNIPIFVYANSVGHFQSFNKCSREIMLCIEENMRLTLYSSCTRETILSENYTKIDETFYFYSEERSLYRVTLTKKDGRYSLAYTKGAVAPRQKKKPQLVSMIQKYVYCLGGIMNNTRTSACERYTIVDNSWSKIQSMNEPRKDHGVVAINTEIYCFGGMEGILQKNCIEKLDTMEEENGWVILSITTKGSFVPINNLEYIVAVQTSLTECIVFEGSPGTFLIDFQSLQLEEKRQYYLKGIHFKQEPLWHNSTVYAIGHEGYYSKLYCYSMYYKRWETIDFDRSYWF